jgi:hypothetical protein
MNNKKELFKKINYEIFYFLSITWLWFFLLEMIFPNIVLSYFNTNIFLFLWLINLFFVLKSNNFSSKKTDDKR